MCLPQHGHERTLKASIKNIDCNTTTERLRWWGDGGACIHAARASTCSSRRRPLSLEPTCSRSCPVLPSASPPRSLCAAAFEKLYCSPTATRQLVTRGGSGGKWVECNFGATSGRTLASRLFVCVWSGASEEKEFKRKNRQWLLMWKHWRRELRRSS